MKQIYIFGHRKPDTDSVTSSIALSYLKNKIGLNTKPVILDPINKETEFVLKKFNIKEPDFLNDVKLQIKDINYYKDFYINCNRTIKQVYDAMAKKNTTGVPIVDDSNNFLGIITSKMIGNEIINGNFASLNTSYENIVDTLDGEEILKFDDEISGNIILPALRSSKIINDVLFKNDDILILGDRYSVLEYAILCKVKLIILVGNTEIKIDHLMLASENRVNIIRTNHGLFHTSKLITLSNYIKDLLTKERAVSFSLADYYDEFKSKALSFGYNNYPIVTSNNKCKGLIRITDINNINKKQVILVDHNEASQSVYGLEEAEIVEIVDHHRIGDLTTNKPINFRNMTVGSTNTIIYLMFIEKNIEIPSDIAGIMLSGIISDTLKFTSPTTTDMDKAAALSLAMSAKVNIDEYALEMFKYGTNLDGRTVQDIINTDIKVYTQKEFKFCISQITTLNSASILDEMNKYIDALDEMKKNKDFDLCLICLTDILKGGSYIICNRSSSDFVKEAFSISDFVQGSFIIDCLSRKNQVVPKIINNIK